MLNHLLAGIVGLGGLSLFLSGFFFPEVRRKTDFAWSGVALLYALLLRIEGDRTSGGALLGHIASVALILWFGWQTLQQRQQFTASEERTLIPNSLETLTPFLRAGWGRITVTYGETVNWIQSQMGNGDTDTAPESLASQPPQNDSLEDAWEDKTAAVSSNLPEPGITADALEHPETELAAPSKSETQIEAPLTAENLPPNVAQLNSADSEDTTPVASDSPAEVSNSPIAAETDQAVEAVSEISHDIQDKETVPASKSAPPEPDQNTLNEEAMHEDIAQDSLPEEDDGSWPPEDPVT